MKAKDAYKFLFYNVYVPAFFEKLARHGYFPRNKEDAGRYLDIGIHFSGSKNAGHGMVKSADAVHPGYIRQQAAILACDPSISYAVAVCRNAILEDR